VVAPDDRFAALARALAADPARPVDLAEAALLVASDHRPGLDVAAWLAKLDALAGAARGTVLAAWSDAARVDALNEFLFVREGFHGNTEEYEDPRNSLLDCVLERRTGLPITLALVYVEVGRRLGLPVEGIGFPSHFLVRWRGREDVVIDPFNGRVLADRALAAMLRQALGQDVVFSRMELEAITPHAFLVRLLSNLKRHTALAGDFAATLLCCERLLQLQPDDPEEVRDRGLVYAELDCVGAARDDLARFLALAPGHPSTASVQARLQDLEARRVVLN
jgi:regulator of sirC expression with transglutaminase-like and TPR domain